MIYLFIYFSALLKIFSSFYMYKHIEEKSPAQIPDPQVKIIFLTNVKETWFHFSKNHQK